MGIALLVLFYGSIVFFLIAVVYKLFKFARSPVNLKWEIYKGSSIYEQSDWWTKKDETFGKKLKAVLADILLQREYYRRNRGFWFVLMTFHIGLYLLILGHAWLFIAAAVIDIETASALGVVLGHIITGLITVGGLGVLIWRLTDADMRAFYPKTHYFKWLFIIITLAGGFYSVQYFFEGSSVNLLYYVNEQIQFDFAHKLHPSLPPALHMLFISFWLIYLPFSHIMQLIFRYYHELRWNHVPNLRGSTIEKKLINQLERRVSWSDPIIQTGMKWGEVAAGIPKDETGAKEE